MELVFLFVLIGLMVAALTAGYPVAFALPGAAILAIVLAALCGYVFAGDASAYFAQDGPRQWLSAGVTNFRSLYWNVERDTLIAIPLFVFMGIMLQRSKIAEDLLVAMAQLFGPVPGGLGISVVFVGALLAATTGIVGATVIAMGLISLPAMLRNRYSHSLACGTICASGTLGQIIPPSVVLIILADQLSSAVDQASTARKAEYREATGEFSMPSEFDPVSASAGDMFMGALIPGLILVGLYMLYILITALLRPKSAPPVPYEGRYDRQFLFRVLMALVPPLALIFAVLGSIVLGIATVNQAGALGAIGALLMAGYRLCAGKSNAYYPALLASVATLAIIILINLFDLNIKSITTTRDLFGVILAAIAIFALLTAVLWSAWRTYQIDDTLRKVMVETAKTTSMVFIILIGAAMLTSAFRGFGGEHLVKEFLTGLPGGFWTQFIVVMVVIFLLGFFLDFIEIAVVVVPIVAPILLADPSANITAVWFGVMVGLNIQTSFLTPPFGFSLFYLRGVAPPKVKTTQIYKGACAFIGLQLLGLAIAGYFPSLVNYMPARTHLTSETAPPPINPNLQLCMEEMVFADYARNEAPIRAAIRTARGMDLSPLPETYRVDLESGIAAAADTFALVAQVQRSEAELNAYIDEYRPQQRKVRQLNIKIRKLEREIKEVRDLRNWRIRNQGISGAQLRELDEQIAQLEREQAALQGRIPPAWAQQKATYKRLYAANKRARVAYRTSVDSAYAPVAKTRSALQQRTALLGLEQQIVALGANVNTPSPAQWLADWEQLDAQLANITGSESIRSTLAESQRAIKNAKPALATQKLRQSRAMLAQEVAWRNAAAELVPDLAGYDAAIAQNIGLRLQKRLSTPQAKQIAACRAVHRDISLNF